MLKNLITIFRRLSSNSTEQIFTTLHKKPTDSHSYLHYNSCHPVHIKNSIIFCQFIRYKRICTRNTDFIDHSKDLTTHLLHKAYPFKVITKQWNKVTKIPRTELLIQTQQTSTNCLPLVQTYHPTIVPINKAVMKECKRYGNMPAAKRLFSSTTLCACRKPSNLRQMLVKTRISTTPTITGNKKCMKSRCQICNIIDTRPSLKIPGTNITVRPGNYYCNSSYVIYLIKCKKCDSGNYIGETSTFIRLCMNNHNESIRDKNKGLPVARYFIIPGHSICDLECVILKGDFSNNAGRLIEEQTLIRKFKTDTHGLNQDLDFLAPYTYFHK